MSKQQYRQGDILFVKCDEIPAEAEKQADGIVAYGEATGHTHRLSEASEAVLKVAAGAMFVEAMKPTQIVHDEHKPLNLPPGNFSVIRQQEHTPEGWRQVAD